MPTKTADQLKTRTANLKKKMADKGGSMDGTARRALQKKIRRVQRKRRRIESTAARIAKAGKAGKEEKTE
jgi:hypothetical protein